MNIRKQFTLKIVLPASDLILKLSVAKHFKFLQQSQWWTKEELYSYQLKKLKELVNFAYEFVPYYKNLFDNNGIKPSDIKKLEDLKKIPVLTKEIMQKNHLLLIPQNELYKRDVIRRHTSGSTGEPLTYLTSKNAYGFNVACNLRGWYWMGYELGDKYVKLSQHSRESLKKRIQDSVNRCKLISADDLSAKNMGKIVDQIIEYKPKVLRAYPDVLLLIAKYIESKGITNLNIEKINTTGNILSKAHRDFIEQKFKCEIFDSYGCEGTAILFECEAGNGYHSAMEYGITEIISESKAMKESGMGKLITTDLQNYAMPMIRYDTQDIVKYLDEDCSCGRKLIKVESIGGRDTDILKFSNGKFLIVHNFTVYFEKMDFVKQFQVRQDEPDSMTIFLVIKNTFTKKNEDSIKKYWKNYLGEEISVNIKIVKTIELSPSGKRRFVVRNPRISLD